MLDDGHSSSGAVPEYIWRIFNFGQMDFQQATTQMINLCRDPRGAYKSTRISKLIRGQWARDDPAFIVILSAMLVVASCAYAIALGCSSWWHLVRVILGSVFLEFLATGFLVATGVNLLCNKYMRTPRATERVEWLYSFDIHCNGFVPYFLIVYVLQFFFLPVVLAEGDWVLTPVVVGNTLYAFALAYYLYITWLGYSELPFLHDKHTLSLLQPVVVISAFYMLSLVFRFNVAYSIHDLYFGD